MKTYNLIKDYLTVEPNWRERKNKNYLISRILKQRYGPSTMYNQLEDVIVEASNLDRVWRKVLQENPHLRGKDYENKKEVEQKKQIDLGYESGYHQNIKKLKTLF